MPEGSTVQVAVRCRPLTGVEKSGGATRVVKLNGDKVLLHGLFPSQGAKEQTYSFNHCYSWDAKNADLYKDIGEPLLWKALEGYHVTVAAFGQTGSGKNETIMGTAEESGLLCFMSEALFNVIADAADLKKYFVTVSFVEICDESVHDLINPSGRDLTIRQHPQLGMYVDDLAEVVVASSDELMAFFEQGNRIRNLSGADARDEARNASVFIVTIEQKSKQSSSMKMLRSVINFVVMPGSDHKSKSETAGHVNPSLDKFEDVIRVLQQSGKSSSVPYGESRLTRLLQESFGGSSYTAFIAHISPTDADFLETFATLKLASQVKNIQNFPKKSESDNVGVIKGLRNEINKLRDRLAACSGNGIDLPNVDDLTRMEGLIKDLQIAKLQSWEEKQRISDMFREERKHNLSNRGILDWVLNSEKKDSKEIEEKLRSIQKEKETLMIKYKEKRKVVDDSKDALQKMITEYAKLTEAGKSDDNEGRQQVAKIHEFKEKLKQENDLLKKLKQNLKDVQDKQKLEKESAKTQAEALRGNIELRYKLEEEQREKMERDNLATLADEIDRIKMEIEQQKVEIKMRSSDARQRAADDMLKTEMELLDVKGEKSAMAFKLRSLEAEKRHLKRDIEEMFKKQKEDMELQQLQYFQAFRQYREVFEEHKAALEQRYRSLLEDSIQDAVYLSSRNQELLEENQMLHQEVAELKDQLSMVSRPASS